MSTAARLTPVVTARRHDAGRAAKRRPARFVAVPTPPPLYIDSVISPQTVTTLPHTSGLSSQRVVTRSMTLEEG